MHPLTVEGKMCWTCGVFIEFTETKTNATDVIMILKEQLTSYVDEFLIYSRKVNYQNIHVHPLNASHNWEFCQIPYFSWFIHVTKVLECIATWTINTNATHMIKSNWFSLKSSKFSTNISTLWRHFRSLHPVHTLALKVPGTVVA